MEKLEFEIAPFEQLCGCVTVELTPKQEHIVDTWPDRRSLIVKAAIDNDQQRHVDAECQLCNATGLKLNN